MINLALKGCSLDFNNGTQRPMTFISDSGVMKIATTQYNIHIFWDGSEYIMPKSSVVVAPIISFTGVDNPSVIKHGVETTLQTDTIYNFAKFVADYDENLTALTLVGLD